MADEGPDYSLKNATGEREAEKPALFLVKYFQVQEADYMKPPLAEQLLEPDGTPAPGILLAANTTRTSACTCTSVCVCVPVSTCACNSVCTCNTVSTTHGVTVVTSPSTTSPSTGGGCGHSVGGGFGGYWAPCF